MTITWRPAARAALRASILYLRTHNPVAAREFKQAVAKATGILDRKPMIARMASYPGMRAWSLPKWSKIIIFREIPDGIEIVTILDTRQEAPDEIS